METNNKLREALKLCVDEMCNRCRDQAAARGDTMPCLSGCEPVRKAKAALAEPVKNFEVGTAEEQERRFVEYCHQHKLPERKCSKCPLLCETIGYCELAWAQMPYEEGVTNAE